MIPSTLVFLLLLLAGLAFVLIMLYRIDRCSRISNVIDGIIRFIGIDPMLAGGLVGIVYVLISFAICYYYKINYYHP